MTDLIAAPGPETAPTTAVAETLPPNDGGRPLEWAPREPAPKKHRTGLWVGIGVGALLVTAGAASMILIAPGTTIAGIPVGGLTPGAAADVVESQLANTEITLTGMGDDQVVSASELGASLDARALAEEAFAAHPMWDVTGWLSEPAPADITLDPVLAHETLRALVPGSYEDSVNAGVVFDEDSSTFVTTPAETGTGIDLDALDSALTAAIADGLPSLSYSGDPAEVPAAISDEDAAGVAETANTMLGTLGFYVGDERTVPIAPKVAATWFAIDAVDDQLEIVADEAAIQSVVDTLSEKVNREPVAAESVVNAGGDVLREITTGENGRELGDVSGAAAEFAAQLENGEAVYALDVTEVEFEHTTLHRYIDVNLSQQQAHLYENGTLVNSWAISSGLSDTPTPTGNFAVFGHTAMQDMGCFEGASYCTENVPYNTWFAPDIAFHGAYWHNNFGQQMSHGCVNLPVWQAEFIYNWAPTGTEVSVHW